MKKQKKRILLVITTLVLGLAGAGAWVLWTFGRPLYLPGMVRAGQNLRGSLEPPGVQQEEGCWMVEPDIRLHHSSIGRGRSILVIHGGPGYPLRPPVPGLDRLSTEYTFHFYDQRGCGKSTRPFDRFESKNFLANMTELERTLGIGAQIADIERIRRLLQEERIILLGHSFGAFLATMYAAEFPERVQALVLVAPSSVLVLPDEDAGFFQLLRDRLPESQRSEYDHFLEDYLDFGSLFDKSEDDLRRLNAKIGRYFQEASGAVANAGLQGENGGWMVQAMYLSMGQRHDYRAALSRIQAPALVLHGEADILPERMSRQYADLLRGSHFHVFTSGHTRAAGPPGHFAFTDQPDEFAKVVGEFLRPLRTPSP